jgi:replicative DNA helicase
MVSEAERLAPHNLEAEKAVLGAVLLDSSLFNQAAQILRPEDFYLESHRKIYRSFMGISETSSSEAIDLVTLRDELARRGVTLEEVGGNAYISSLIDGLPRYSNIEHYARIVKDRALLRRLINACTQITNDCFAAEEECRLILDRASSLVYSIADEGFRGQGFVSVEELAAPTLEKLAKMVDARSGVTGVPTGFIDFDNITAGLHGGDLIVLASRPGMGKTSLALNIALYGGRVDRCVGIFSLEMDSEQLFIRMVCSEARVNSQRVRTGRISNEEFKRLAPKLDAFMRYKIFIDDTPALGLTETRAKARRLKAEHNLDLLVIDYLQLMSTGRRFENRNLEIGYLTHGLKALSKELDIPVLVLSQLSRAPESRSDHKPQLADLRESGNIEQDADLVCFLYREEYYNPTDENAGLAELIVAKNRNGPVGSVQLVFFSDYTRFQDYTPAQEE